MVNITACTKTSRHDFTASRNAELTMFMSSMSC